MNETLIKEMTIEKNKIDKKINDLKIPNINKKEYILYESIIIALSILAALFMPLVQSQDIIINASRLVILTGILPITSIFIGTTYLGKKFINNKLFQKEKSALKAQSDILNEKIKQAKEITSQLSNKEIAIELENNIKADQELKHKLNNLKTDLLLYYNIGLDKDKYIKYYNKRILGSKAKKEGYNSEQIKKIRSYIRTNVKESSVK